MNEAELDEVYGELCRVLTAQGEPKALAMLARFALLAVHEIGDVQRIRALIADAARGS
jgi:hypothetical protein